MSGNIERKPWEAFRDSGLLWWVNRSLHLFGMCIVLEEEEDGTVTDAYPARTSWRGFSGPDEADGFLKVTGYLAQAGGVLLGEVSSPLGLADALAGIPMRVECIECGTMVDPPEDDSDPICSECQEESDAEEK